MTGRMRWAVDLIYALETNDIGLAAEDGGLAFRFGPTSPRLTPGIAQRVLGLEPELLSIVGWNERPPICPACASTDFYRRLDGSWGCSGCWPDAAAAFNGKPTTGKAVAHA